MPWDHYSADDLGVSHGHDIRAHAQFGHLARGNLGTTRLQAHADPRVVALESLRRIAQHGGQAGGVKDNYFGRRPPTARDNNEA
jgi:hypothetical protein